MENLEEIKQEETIPPQPSPKKKYLLIGVILAIIVIVGGTLIYFILNQEEEDILQDIPSRNLEREKQPSSSISSYVPGSLTIGINHVGSIEVERLELQLIREIVREEEAPKTITLHEIDENIVLEQKIEQEYGQYYDVYYVGEKVDGSIYLSSFGNSFIAFYDFEYQDDVYILIVSLERGINPWTNIWHWSLYNLGKEGLALVGNFSTGEYDFAEPLIFGVGDSILVMGGSIWRSGSFIESEKFITSLKDGEDKTLSSGSCYSILSDYPIETPPLEYRTLCSAELLFLEHEGAFHIKIIKQNLTPEEKVVSTEEMYYILSENGEFLDVTSNF
ncbi:hypothetical protein IID24_00195 [Patescibacteria group bacterium]|nr:hypothetical protein [Patescibacteria group bacterium]